MAGSRVLVDRYTLVRQLGAGAQGTVWLARDETLRREVAVKQVSNTERQFGEAGEIARARAMREGRIAARLSHPNAVSVYDVALHDGNPWLVMEYVPSRTLTEVVRAQGGIPPRQAAALGAQIADALAEAHRLGIVHRDVKPSNILLTADGKAKITDFGIARGNEDATLTATGLVTGTPAYFAPELARGVTGPTPATDIWSLGATLYYAVEGMPPFGTDENPLVLLGRIASQEVQRPVRAGELEHVLLRMLSRDAVLRPTMTQVRAMLATIAGTISTVPVLVAEPNTEENDAVEVADATRVAAVEPVVAPAWAEAEPDGEPEEPADAAEAAVAEPAAPEDSGGNSAADDPPPVTPQAQPPLQPPVPKPEHLTAPIDNLYAPEPRPQPQALAAPMDQGRPAPPAPPMYPESPAPPPDRRRTRGIVLIAACAIVLAFAGIGSYLLLDRDRDANRTGPEQSTPAKPSPSEEPSKQPESDPPSPTKEQQPSSPPETAAGSPMQADKMAALVSDYYSLLPGNQEKAWTWLGPQLRRQGFASYSKWWSLVRSVRISNLSADPSSGTVRGRVHYVMKNGDVSSEPTSLGLIETNDGKGLLINTDN